MTPSNPNGSATMANDTLAVSINQLIHKIDALDNKVNRLQQTLQEAPGMAAMATDIIDEAIRTTGVDVESRAKAGLQILVQLTEPATLAALQQGLQALSDAPGLISMVADIMDEQIGTATQEGIDIGMRLKGLLALANRLSDPNTTASLEHVLEPRAVAAIGALGTAIAESKNQSHSPVGPLGLIRALRDPDVQRATSFLVAIAKRMGQELKNI